jgi:hypothetical protein
LEDLGASVVVLESAWGHSLPVGSWACIPPESAQVTDGHLVSAEEMWAEGKWGSGMVKGAGAGNGLEPPDPEAAASVAHRSNGSL